MITMIRQRLRSCRSCIAVAAPWLILSATSIADDHGRHLDGLENITKITVLCAVFAYVGRRIEKAVFKIGKGIEQAVTDAVSLAVANFLAGSKIEQALADAGELASAATQAAQAAAAVSAVNLPRRSAGLVAVPSQADRR